MVRFAGRTQGVVTPLKNQSFSRWDQHEKCARRFKLRYLDKHPDPSGPAAERGNQFHSRGEDFLNAASPLIIPEGYEFFTNDLWTLRSFNAKSEEMWAVDREWNPVRSDDFERAYLRCKIDAHYIDWAEECLVIIDFKTGKVYSSSREQNKLYALTGFAFYDLPRIRTELWYLDKKCKVKDEYQREQADSLADLWERRFRRMDEDKWFIPNPSPLCGWCPYSKEKQGLCEF